MGEGMACGGLPFPGTGCPIPDVDYLCLLCIDFYVWDAVSNFNHLPRMFLSTDFAFRITEWTCCNGPHLHAILRIISRGVSGLATDSPCGVWGRGWTTCLLHDSPLFGSHFKMRVGIQVWSDISYIYFLPLFTVSCMKPMIFLLCNNLFIYQVLCTLIYRRRSLYSFLSNCMRTRVIEAQVTHVWRKFDPQPPNASVTSHSQSPYGLFPGCPRSVLNKNRMSTHGAHAGPVWCRTNFAIPHGACRVLMHAL